MGVLFHDEDHTITRYAPNKVVQDGVSTGATTIESYYLDGRLKSVTGTAVVHEYYTYDVNVENDGTQWSQVNVAIPDGEGIPGDERWVKTTTDMLGRTVKVVKGSEHQAQCK